MMRVCHLNTCPAGIATQNPELRERVRQYVSEIIDLADRDVLNSLPSRTVEQDVLD